MNSNKIRSTFLEYFSKNGHEIVHSSPLVPHNDPTLMFANSGMVQFKNVFTGKEKLEFNKAVTAANSGDVGTVFYSCDEGILNVAITLNPEVIKSKAIQVHYLMTLGLSDTLAALVPPEIEISHIWPNLMFMNRGVMGQVLLYSSGEELNEVPSWIVTGVQIRREVECLKFHDVSF